MVDTFVYEDGREIDLPEGTIYEVTGTGIHGQRFPVIKTTNIRHAFMINLYRGTRWARLPDSDKRIKLQEVWN